MKEIIQGKDKMCNRRILRGQIEISFLISTAKLRTLLVIGARYNRELGV
jgi:hypothetical protein